ncbi:MAG: hypothetical protein JJU27_16030 [Gammaproteobacteria bacterium]|nr:hypothetical protein [Gammaproteobacteria bacterium]
MVQAQAETTRGRVIRSYPDFPALVMETQISPSIETLYPQLPEIHLPLVGEDNVDATGKHAGLTQPKLRDITIGNRQVLLPLSRDPEITLRHSQCHLPGAFAPVRALRATLSTEVLAPIQAPDYPAVVQLTTEGTNVAYEVATVAINLMLEEALIEYFLRPIACTDAQLRKDAATRRVIGHPLHFHGHDRHMDQRASRCRLDAKSMLKKELVHVAPVAMQRRKQMIKLARKHV